MCPAEKDQNRYRNNPYRKNEVDRQKFLADSILDRASFPGFFKLAFSSCFFKLAFSSCLFQLV
jgi:hypothetical protein